MQHAHEIVDYTASHAHTDNNDYKGRLSCFGQALDYRQIGLMTVDSKEAGNAAYVIDMHMRDD